MQRLESTNSFTSDKGHNKRKSTGQEHGPRRGGGGRARIMSAIRVATLDRESDRRVGRVGITGHAHCVHRWAIVAAVNLAGDGFKLIIQLVQLSRTAKSTCKGLG